MGPLALWVPTDDDAGPPQTWMEDTHRGRVGHRQTTLGAWTWPRFRAEPPWGFTNPAQAFVFLPVELLLAELVFAELFACRTLTCRSQLH